MTAYPDPFADAMLKLADMLFTEFDDLPVMTVMREISASRAGCDGDFVDVTAVEVRARRRLNAARAAAHPGSRAGRWLAAVLCCLPVLNDALQSSLAA